jgi:lipopolysaccharide assembly outer membrane protein LptD (OstA)
MTNPTNQFSLTTRIFALLLLLAGVGVSGSAILAQDNTQSPQPQPSPQQTANTKQPAAMTKKRRVDYKSGKHKLVDGIHQMSGGVRFVSEDTILTTDAAGYNEKTGIASSPGKVQIEDTFNNITGNTGTAYYKTRDAKFRGNVVIIAKPRPENLSAPEGSARKQFDSPATITCESVDYNWGTRIAELTGNLKIVQKDRTVTALTAVYDGKNEIVTLQGNVVYKDSKGQNFTAQKVVMNIKEGQESFVADGVKGDFEIEDEDAPPTNSPTTPATPQPDKPITGQLEIP